VASATEGLERHRSAVHDGERRVRELEGEVRKSARAIPRLQAEAADYHGGVERGEDPDPERERELTEAIRAAEEAVVRRPVLGPPAAHRGTPRAVVGEEIVDLRVEARLNAAREVLETRRAELRRFAAEGLDAIGAERAGHSLEVGRRFAAALDALVDADREHGAERGWWIELLRDAGAEHRIAELPEGVELAALNPAIAEAGHLRRTDPAGLVPAPRTFIEREEQHGA